ncbi:MULTISPECIES: hypothetical protein [unclassified Streptomyces]|uniref:hypothetical protein n=1 Tax=unclassified Streptomyces TaxID=2593676 RepID=UPI00119E5FD0|nr:hypothetical protein [Streptomyces sp. BK340]TVZ80474.1 hypothetical protein FB157_12960 [Streptomyces sp. BK340]
MRPLYVPVRLVVTVLALTAAAGCVSVGDDAGRARPSHSAGQRGGEAPDGGPVDVGGGLGHGGGGSGDGKHEHGGKKKRGESATPSVTPSVPGSVSAAPPQPGKTVDPAPAHTIEPTPTQTAEPQPTPTEEPTPASTPPPSAEPSSSAHEETGPQLVQREPAPEAGTPA